MRRLPLLMTSIASVLLAACHGSAPEAMPSKGEGQLAGVAARLGTAVTFRQAANDSAVWVDPADASRSIVFVSGGEGGLEMNDLAGTRIARIESLEVGFIDVRQNVGSGDGALDLVIASDERLGAVHVYRFDPGSRQMQPLTKAPIAVNDAITGLCTYSSPLTGKLYAFVATEQGQIEQWELFIDRGTANGRFVRRIAAGTGAGHCVVDDATSALYFSEETVGIWKVPAEPESDAERTVVDLIEPRGSLHEEVKGIALYRRDGQAPYLIAADVGNSSFNIYSLGGERAGSFKIEGNGIELGEAEGLTAVSSALGKEFPDGAVVVADDDAGNYKVVGWSDIVSKLSLRPSATSEPAPTALARHTVEPSVETEPVDSYGDAADDPAIWVDRANPARSVVIGTDKKLGLHVYDLAGKRLQTVPDGRMNNVDLRDGFMLAGKPTTVVTATNRTTKSISVYRFDHATRQLTSIADGTLDTALGDPYGLCMYHSAKTGDFYVLANDSVDGKVRQWKLVERSGKVGIEQVRDIDVGSQTEGCATDDELGHLYVGEEDVALWKYSAEPDGGATRTPVDTVKDGNLVDDVEGVAVYYGANGAGYIVVSSQGDDSYAVYRREGKNEFLGKFRVVANEERGIDGASETDGLDIVSAPLGADFPMGLLVVQDGRNLMPVERQNFKFVSWKEALDALR